MRTIDLDHWPRKEHFLLFNGFNHPHYSMVANVDLKSFYPYIKQHGISFTAAIVYLISRSANSIPEFRQRIHGDAVVEHQVVHPAFTVLVEGDLFGFCTVDYVEDFTRFAACVAERMAYVKANPTLADESETDNLLFLTALPWISFTSFTHPMRLHPADSVPRFAWGKFFPEGASIKMPLGVQAHHALVDGIHMGWFYQRMQEYLDNAEKILA